MMRFGLKQVPILLDVSTDPLDITSSWNKPMGGPYSVHGLLDLAGLYSVELSVVLMLGVITFMTSLIMLFVVKKKETRAELKQDAIYKLVLVFIASSAVTFFDALLLLGGMFV